MQIEILKKQIKITEQGDISEDDWRMYRNTIAGFLKKRYRKVGHLKSTFYKERICKHSARLGENRRTTSPKQDYSVKRRTYGTRGAHVVGRHCRRQRPAAHGVRSFN
ncbi:uncharacterized protein [Periplaneta americana]|uniref:uncharacterized protein n=1 Tax=Periplaneta americana TaxID=6978 RepID=UPI0037E75398